MSIRFSILVLLGSPCRKKFCFQELLSHHGKTTSVVMPSWQASVNRHGKGSPVAQPILDTLWTNLNFFLTYVCFLTFWAPLCVLQLVCGIFCNMTKVLCEILLFLPASLPKWQTYVGGTGGQPQGPWWGWDLCMGYRGPWTAYNGLMG